MTTAPEVDELYSDQIYSHEIVFWQNKNFGPQSTCLHLFLALKSEMCVWKKKISWSMATCVSIEGNMMIHRTIILVFSDNWIST